MKKVAGPTLQFEFKPICSYCGADTSKQPNDSCDTLVGPRMAVLACSDHKNDAARDGRAWMHKNGIVQRADVRDDPLFEALGMTEDHWLGRVPAPRNLTVKRSSKALEPGWALICRTTWLTTPLERDDDGKWHIPAEGPGGVSKSIFVDELTLSLPEEKHGLVAAFVARLNAGIYKADAEAHDAAVAAGGAP